VKAFGSPRGLSLPLFSSLVGVQNWVSSAWADVRLGLPPLMSWSLFPSLGPEAHARLTLGLPLSFFLLFFSCGCFVKWPNLCFETTACRPGA
jgi:hypothetical protein